MTKKRTQENTDRLTYYEDLAAQGRLLILPCAAGDSYFTIEKFCDEYGELEEATVHYQMDCANCWNPSACDAELRIVERTFRSVVEIIRHEKQIGKGMFLTRADAEAELAVRAAQRMTDCNDKRR